MPETENIFHAEPGEFYHPREELYYPLFFVDTMAGVLTVRGRDMVEEVSLNNKPLIDSIDGPSIDAAYAEKGKKAEIVIVKMGEQKEPYNNRRFFIDFGVSPPFISPEAMEIEQYPDGFYYYSEALFPPRRNGAPPSPKSPTACLNSPAL